MDKTCTKCGAELVPCVAYSAIGGKLMVTRAPMKSITPPDRSTKVIPYVCPDCGHIEWYAENPAAIRNL